MKIYTSPEMNVMSFSPEEAIAAVAQSEGSHVFNDAQFGGW